MNWSLYRPQLCLWKLEISVYGGGNLPRTGSQDQEGVKEHQRMEPWESLGAASKIMTPLPSPNLLFSSQCSPPQGKWWSGGCRVSPLVLPETLSSSFYLGFLMPNGASGQGHPADQGCEYYLPPQPENSGSSREDLGNVLITYALHTNSALQAELRPRISALCPTVVL